MKVLTIGTFDVLHFGHIGFLTECRRLGSDLVVGLNSDRFVKEFKGEPVMDFAERYHALSLLGYRVSVNDGPGRELVEVQKPDVLAVGSDWAGRDYFAQIDVTQQWLDERRIILAYVPRVQGLPMSTTEIRRRIVGQDDRRQRLTELASGGVTVHACG